MQATSQQAGIVDRRTDDLRLETEAAILMISVYYKLHKGPCTRMRAAHDRQAVARRDRVLGGVSVGWICHALFGVIRFQPPLAETRDVRRVIAVVG